MAQPLEPPFEKTVVAETPTEFALLRRIEQLKRQIWEGGRYYQTMDGFPPDPNEQILSVQNFNPVLQLAGTSEASLEIPHGVRIEARTRGPTMLGYGFYMGRDEIRAMSTGREARILTLLLEKAARSAAELLLTTSEK